VSVRGAIEERIALMAPSRRLRMALAEQTLGDFAAGRRIRVLDAGCGDGLLTLALAARHPGWTLTGMDLREELLRGARERATSRGLVNIGFEPADLTRPLPDSGFDVVMALECLSEIPDDRGALRSMTGALAPGGLFVVQVPDRNWKPVLRESAGTWREEVRHGYSQGDLGDLLAEAGLEVVAVEPTYRSTAAAAQELRDRVKDRGLILRASLFPAMLAAVRLERWGLTGGPANALFATARRSLKGDGNHGAAL
jgi:trans-aconitate methyltransferase